MYSFYPPVALALLLCGFASREEQVGSGLRQACVRRSLLLLGEYFQVQGGYLDISSDAQANRQDLHGLRGQLVFIVSQHGPHTARGPGRQLRLQGLRGRGAGLP